MEQHEIPVEVRRVIIDQELQMYRNTRYQMQLRYRVQKGIGTPEDALKTIEAELTRIENALDLLEGEREALR